jgi:hypothetical protein
VAVVALVVVHAACGDRVRDWQIVTYQRGPWARVIILKIAFAGTAGSGKVDAGFPSRQTRSLCAEIMRKK